MCINNYLAITNNILAIIFFGLSIIIPVVINSFYYKSIKTNYLEYLMKYTFFFNIGCLFLLGFIGQILYPSDIANILSWKQSPFQYQLAFSELAIAALGFIGTLSKKGFWLATIINTVIWLLGASLVQILFTKSGISFIAYWNIFIALWLILIYSIYTNYHNTN